MEPSPSLRFDFGSSHQDWWKSSSSKSRYWKTPRRRIHFPTYMAKNGKLWDLIDLIWFNSLLLTHQFAKGPALDVYNLYYIVKIPVEVSNNMQPPWQLFLVRGTGSIGLHTYYCQSLVTACTHFWKFEQLVSGEEINISIGTKSIYQEIWGTGHNCLGKYVRSNSVFCSQLCFIRCPEVGDCRLWLTWEKRGSRDSFESNGCGWLDTIMPNHTQPFVRKFECYLQAVSWSWLSFFCQVDG